jgi:hypothetical protein
MCSEARALKAALLDQLVGACKQRRGHGEAERLGGLEMLSSTLTACWTGRSAGFSLLRILWACQ